MLAPVSPHPIKRERAPYCAVIVVVRSVHSETLSFQPSARPGLAQTLNPTPGRCHSKPKATPSFPHPSSTLHRPDNSTTHRGHSLSHSFSAASSAPHSLRASSHAPPVAHHCRAEPTSSARNRPSEFPPLHTAAPRTTHAIMPQCLSHRIWVYPSHVLRALYDLPFAALSFFHLSLPQ